MMSFRACAVFPAASSTRADAIQPGPCLGLVSRTDFSRRRALLMSPTSAADAIFVAERLVRYPLGSITV